MLRSRRAAGLLPAAQSTGRSRTASIGTNGNGTFVDVTAQALGVAATFGPALGVATADFDGDGWIDIFVANDGEENQLWINQRNGTFKDTALLAASALDADGQGDASMGVDAGDFDNDGDEDLFMTELTSEGNTLFVNDGTGHVRGPEGALGPRLAEPRRTPASAPPGSTSTTTAGSTS